jgi:hypothetical protein
MIFIALNEEESLQKVEEIQEIFPEVKDQIQNAKQQ